MRLKEAIEIDKNVSIEQNFEQIANNILKRGELFVRKNSFRITELSFHYYNENHKDPHCRRLRSQLTNGELIMFKGEYGPLIDITFGNQESNSYGGILIRSLVNDISKKSYYGPINVSNYISSSLKLKKINVNDVVNLSNISAIRLKINDEPNGALKMFSFPRVATEIFNTNIKDIEDFRYVFKNYLYSTNRMFDRKKYNLHLITFSQYLQGKTEREISAIKLDYEKIAEYKDKFSIGKDCRINDFIDVNPKKMGINILKFYGSWSDYFRTNSFGKKINQLF